MRDHQKYFAVEDAAGKLAPQFPGGAEYRQRSAGTDPSRKRACVASSIQRRAVLWETDQKKSLLERLDLAEYVNFQKIGSYFENNGARGAAVQTG